MDLTETYIGVVGIAVTIIIAVIGWWLAYRKKKEQPTNSQKMDQNISQRQNVVVNVQTPVPEQPSRLSPKPRKEKPSRAAPPRTKQQLLDGVIAVEPGDYEDVSLELEENDLLEGVLQDEYRQDFRYLLLDQRNFVKYVGDENYSAVLDKDYNKIYLVKKKIKKAGTYHLVIDLYGKQNERAVRVNLSVTRG